MVHPKEKCGCEEDVRLSVVLPVFVSGDDDDDGAWVEQKNVCCSARVRRCRRSLHDEDFRFDGCPGSAVENVSVVILIG